jgi:hypothetical protein
MKWWWAIFFWALGLAITYVYMVYTTFMRDEEVAEENILSQHSFRKAISLAWINPEQHYQMGNIRKGDNTIFSTSHGKQQEEEKHEK